MSPGLTVDVSMSGEPHRPREGRNDGNAALARRSSVGQHGEDQTELLRRRTQNMDYVWRSAVAGGLAGCAVSFY